MPLSDLSQIYLPALEDELRRAVGSGPAHLADYYVMLTYHMGWSDGQAGGKRIRPLLTLLCCSAVGGDWQQALPMAAAIELLHNFSLIHDDIQDNSPLRRGRATVWSRWGAPQAINAGDAMFTLAHLAPQALAARGAEAALALRALELFDQTCLALTQGQYLDMSFETRERVAVAEYLTMIEGKTAALIATAARLGALLGGAEPARADSFHQFGRSLGLAFQVQDDLLGIWGDPKVTGKSAASDLEKRKKSLPVVYALERLPDFARAYAQPQAPGAPLTTMVEMLDEIGARTFAEGKVAELTAEAQRHLDAAHPQGEAGAALHELTGQLLNRNT